MTDVEEGVHCPFQEKNTDHLPTHGWKTVQEERGLRASPLGSPASPPQDESYRQMNINFAAATPGAQNSSNWAVFSSGDPRPNPTTWGAHASARWRENGVKRREDT
jgi:hypothetical protein